MTLIKEAPVCSGEEVDNPGRRRFLMGIAGAVVGTPTALLELSTPDKKSIYKGGDVSLFPGIFEARVEAAFITPSEGHMPFLREAILKSPTLLHLTRDFVGYLTQNQKEGNRVALGDALSYSINSAREFLEKESMIDPKTGTNLDLESAHAGIFVFAAGFLTHLDRNELKQFGGEIKEGQSMKDYFWGDNGIGTIVFPKLFGVPGFEDMDREIRNAGYTPRYLGQDRAVHFAQHLFLAFTYLYLRHFKLPEQSRMPRIAEHGLSLWGLLHGGSKEEEARLLSHASGRFYELFSSNNNLPIFKGRRDINEGWFEDMVLADLNGNELGLNTAILLWRSLRLGKSIDPIFEALNDERLQRFETEPVLRI